MIACKIKSEMIFNELEMCISVVSLYHKVTKTFSFKDDGKIISLGKKT